MPGLGHTAKVPFWRHCHSLPCATSRHTAKEPFFAVCQDQRTRQRGKAGWAVASLCRVPRPRAHGKEPLLCLFLPCALRPAHGKNSRSVQFCVVFVDVTLFCHDPDYVLGKIFAVCPKSGSRQRQALPAAVYREPFAVCIMAFAVCLRHMAKDLVPVVVGAGAGHLPPTNHFQNMKKIEKQQKQKNKKEKISLLTDHHHKPLSYQGTIFFDEICTLP